MNLEECKRKFENDPVFHAAVKMNLQLIEGMNLAPSEARDAAMFAHYYIETRRARPFPAGSK